MPDQCRSRTGRHPGGALALRCAAEASSVIQLLSKLLAGGLSASVILIWWPRFFPADNVETWLIRGVVWTLMFELLLHAVGPLEQGLWRSPAASRGAPRAPARAPPPPPRAGSARASPARCREPTAGFAGCSPARRWSCRSR